MCHKRFHRSVGSKRRTGRTGRGGNNGNNGRGGKAEDEKDGVLDMASDANSVTTGERSITGATGPAAGREGTGAETAEVLSA